MDGLFVEQAIQAAASTAYLTGTPILRLAYPARARAKRSI